MIDCALFSQRGGLWLYGTFSGGFLSWPFARIDVFTDRLEIVGTRYSREEILSLHRKRGLFSNGLQVRHCKYGKPESVVFWSFNFGALKHALEEAGFNVEA